MAGGESGEVRQLLDGNRLDRLLVDPVEHPAHRRRERRQFPAGRRTPQLPQQKDQFEERPQRIFGKVAVDQAADMERSGFRQLHHRIGRQVILISLRLKGDDQPVTAATPLRHAPLQKGVHQ